MIQTHKLSAITSIFFFRIFLLLKESQKKKFIKDYLEIETQQILFPTIIVLNFKTTHIF